MLSSRTFRASLTEPEFPLIASHILRQPGNFPEHQYCDSA